MSSSGKSTNMSRRIVASCQVRGGCKNLVLDLGVVLEGQHAWELPEVLLGAVR
jgi:hypothetical protein